MGGIFSRVSCWCAINHNPNGVAHDHSRGIGHCPRCDLHRRAISRGSVSTTSTEDLPRPRNSVSPRYSVSPDPELLYGPPHPDNPNIPRQSTPSLSRYVPARDDTDSPSYISETTVPSHSVSPTERMRENRRRSQAEVNNTMDLLNRELATTMRRFTPGRHARTEESSGTRTPSDLSQSSTVVEQHADAGRRRRSPSRLRPEAGSGYEEDDEQEEEDRGRRATRASRMGRARGRMTMGQRLPRQRRR